MWRSSLTISRTGSVLTNFFRPQTRCSSWRLVSTRSALTESSKSTRYSVAVMWTGRRATITPRRRSRCSGLPGVSRLRCAALILSARSVGEKGFAPGCPPRAMPEAAPVSAALSTRVYLCIQV